MRFLPGVAFVIEVKHGELRTYAPRRLPVGFVTAVQDKIDRGELTSGVIYGKSQRGGLTLGFLGAPERVQQPLLSNWHAHKLSY